MWSAASSGCATASPRSSAERPRARGSEARFSPAATVGSPRGMKLLVLASEPVGADDVRAALGAEGAEVEGAEVLVVSPAINESPVAFWMSDSDEAISEAESAAERTAASLRGEGAQARARAGESEPLLALQDALATYPADRILVFAREGEAARYREDEVFGEAERRFGVPVVECAVRD
jgi:hypothetical protein